MTATPTLEEICREIIAIDKERDALTGRIDLIETRRGELEALMTQMIENGSTFKDMTIEGRKVYIQTTRRPYPKRSKADLIVALKANGFGHIVSEGYNGNTLFGITNEFFRLATQGMSDLERRVFDANTAIPEGLREDLSLAARFEIRTTRGK